MALARARCGPNVITHLTPGWNQHQEGEWGIFGHSAGCFALSLPSVLCMWMKERNRRSSPVDWHWWSYDFPSAHLHELLIPSVTVSECCHHHSCDIKVFDLKTGCPPPPAKNRIFLLIYLVKQNNAFWVQKANTQASVRQLLAERVMWLNKICAYVKVKLWFFFFYFCSWTHFYKLHWACFKALEICGK